MSDLISQREREPRHVSVELNEDQVDCIIRALEQYEKRCKQNSASAMHNGYGTVTSIEKAANWSQEADYARELQSHIGNQTI